MWKIAFEGWGEGGTLGYEKISGGIFDGPQIRKLMKDPNFVHTMSATEKNAWHSFVAVVKGFLGNKERSKLKDISQQNAHMLSKVGL